MPNEFLIGEFNEIGDLIHFPSEAREIMVPDLHYKVKSWAACFPV